MRDIRDQKDRHSIILDQHTAILRQIQQHLGLDPLQTDIPGPSEPRVPVEETMPPKETTRIEAKILIQPTQEATTDASTPQDPTIA